MKTVSQVTAIYLPRQHSKTKRFIAVKLAKLGCIDYTGNRLASWKFCSRNCLRGQRPKSTMTICIKTDILIWLYQCCGRQNSTLQ